MDTASEFIELMESRRSMYSFFSRLYRSEVDQAFLDEMGTLGLSAVEGEGMYAEGARKLGAALEGLGFNARTDLAVDYAHTFLAAGISNGEAAFP